MLLTPDNEYVKKHNGLRYLIYVTNVEPAPKSLLSEN